MEFVHAWDIDVLGGICKKIARETLAHWQAGECDVCGGSKLTNNHACTRALQRHWSRAHLK